MLTAQYQLVQDASEVAAHAHEMDLHRVPLAGWTWAAWVREHTRLRDFFRQRAILARWRRIVRKRMGQA